MIAPPSVDEVVVPNVFPRFVIVVVGSVIDIIKRDYRADALDILKAGFYIVISTRRWY